ncbi:hypothetical protein [Spiroplasma ixodetis]|uniref:hypothetical protein n=1 Tax=Spiroplasma ixodetis TaxID=2141 RepID=UPI00257831EF|nr:hypothetical protein [Spiroplasma ixodetis]
MKLNEFNNAFQTEQDCLKYIASLKKNKCIMCSWTSLNTSNLRRIRCLKCHQTWHKLVKFTPIIFNLDSMISLNN